MRPGTAPSSSINNAHVQPLEGVRVSGESTLMAMPDYVELILGIQTDGATATRALNENAAAMERVRRAALGLNVLPPDLQATILGVYPIYHPQMPADPAQVPQPAAAAGQPPTQSGVPGVIGYRVSSVLKVLVRDLGRVGEAVDVLAGSGAMLSGGVVCRLNENSPLRRHVLDLAMKASKLKAEALAHAARRTLGTPISIEEEIVVDASVPPGARESMISARVTVLYRFD